MQTDVLISSKKWDLKIASKWTLIAWFEIRLLPIDSYDSQHFRLWANNMDLSDERILKSMDFEICLFEISILFDQRQEWCV